MRQMRRCDFIVLSSVLSIASCSFEAGEEPVSVGATGRSLSMSNDLSYNRLVYNRLVYNRMSDNRLVYNRLSENRLVYNSLDGLETTEGGRELLLYVARCALTYGDILVTTHEGVEYEFPGLLGLAPSWVDQALTTRQERMISACLIAHVNAYGVSVLVSMRSPGAIMASEDEMQDFPVYEATFFGNVFGSTLETYACIGSNPAIAGALSTSRALRVCADPTPDCEVQALGYCRDICDEYSMEYGWSECRAGSTVYHETVSTFLAGDTSSSCDTSESRRDSCDVECDHDASIVNLSRADDCAVTCQNDSFCTLFGLRAEGFQANVVCGSIAEVNCHRAEDCDVTCEGTDTQCDIDCRRAESCKEGIKCRSGARCLLKCTRSENCGFAQCEGQLHMCANDITVCNQECPM